MLFASGVIFGPIIWQERVYFPYFDWPLARVSARAALRILGPVWPKGRLRRVVLPESASQKLIMGRLQPGERVLSC